MRHANVIAAAVAALGPVPAQAAAFAGVADVLERSCLECHDAATQKGELDLLAPRAPLARLQLVARARDRVAAGTMPPPDAEPLAAADRARLLGHCATVLRTEVPRLPPQPDRVTVRRLSRGQWEHTVFDLFGVRVPAAAAFPADDLGYGFDTVGDALSFSTLHLEKYVAAAREVATAVFAADPFAPPPTVRREAEAMAVIAGPGVNQSGDVAGFYANATLGTEVVLPRDGVYRLRAFAGSTPAGAEAAQLAMLLDGRQLDVFEVPQRELVPLQVTVPLLGGAHRLGLQFVNDYWDPDHPDPARRDRNLHVDCLEIEGPIDAAPAVPQRQWLVAVDRNESAAARLRPLAAAIAERVWRRAPAAADVERLFAVGQQALARGEPVLVAARELLVAALVSPRFLFRLESAPASAAGAATAATTAVRCVRVPAPDLAVRLAYFLWSSAPDAALLALGDSGRLAEREVLEAEVARLLADPRADRLATEFCAQWLELRALDVRTPDAGLFPGFDAALRAAMRRQTEALFGAVMREGRDVRELLDCDFAVVDAALARLYGLAGEFDAPTRITLPPAWRYRGGLLGHAAVHAITSNPTRTSPVKRGKWILDNLLGQAPGAPAPGSDRFADEQRATVPTGLRAQLAVHRQRDECAVCHARMDAFGLLLENFDAIGRHRDRDADGPIDASGELPDGRRLDGLDDLAAAVRDDPAFVRTLARKLFVFAVGRPPSVLEGLRLDLVVDERLARGRVTIADLVLDVVRSDGFLYRAAP